jgi:hypothetical protein
MIVGRLWNASINPCEPSIPGGIASEPKTNFVPAVEVSIILITISFSHKKSLAPIGTTKMNNANINCNPTPVSIVIQFIFFRLVENNQPIPMNAKIPKKLIMLNTISAPLYFTPEGVDQF